LTIRLRPEHMSRVVGSDRPVNLVFVVVVVAAAAAAFAFVVAVLDMLALPVVHIQDTGPKVRREQQD
jgi:hypothetical protein